jgi:cytochrome bd-type quinol oxidase subunit 2
MYQTLTFLHSLTRWLVLLSLLYAIFRSFKGYFSGRKFTKTDDSVRHWTATIAHIQLIIGMIFYFKSPVIQYFWKNLNDAKESFEHLFFGLIHISLMITAIIIITIGSALAKRKDSDKEKFKTIGIWFSIALIIIFIAIPWPFSPFANRPYFR